jgi:hypothetical protein
VIRSAVLIFSEDPLAAALLGAAVELVGFEPTFPLRGESPRQALLRKRPPLVLVDSDDEAACRPSFLGPALMTGARVLLLCRRRALHYGATIATHLGLRTIEMPVDLASMAAALETELEAAGR